MASTIKIKRSGVVGKQPNTSTISVGELAINYKDQKLYSSNGTAIFEIGAAGVSSNSFSGILVGSNVVVADTTTDRLTLVAGSKISLAGNPTTDTIIIAAQTTEYLQVANADSTYATKSNPTTSGLLAHTGRVTISTNLTVSGNTVFGASGKTQSSTGAWSHTGGITLTGSGNNYFGYANTSGSIKYYTQYNSATNSLDTIFV